MVTRRMNLIERIVRTERIVWILPARLVIGLALFMPVGGGIGTLFPACIGSRDAANAGAPLIHCEALRAIEVIAGLGFLCGAFVRLLIIPAFVDFAIRVASNFGASFPDANPMLSIFNVRGDWAFGALYIGAILLGHDVWRVGAGAYSFDRMLFRTVPRIWCAHS